MQFYISFFFIYDANSGFLLLSSDYVLHFLYKNCSLDNYIPLDIKNQVYLLFHQLKVRFTKKKFIFLIKDKSKKSIIQFLIA